MPITIGARPESDITDPIGVLSDCHRRIERFLSVLQKLAAERQGGALNEQEQNALAASLRIFARRRRSTRRMRRRAFPRMRDAGPAATRRI